MAEHEGRVVVYRDKGDEWRWKHVTDNNRTTAASGEAFADRANAVRAARDEYPDLPMAMDYGDDL